MSKERELTYDERQDLIYGLRMRSNYIETGQVIVNAEDIRRGATAGKIKNLTPCQRECLRRQEEMIELLHNNQVFIKELK